MIESHKAGLIMNKLFDLKLIMSSSTYLEDNYVDLGRKQAKKRYKTTQGDRNTKRSNLNLKMTNGFFNIYNQY